MGGHGLHAVTPARSAACPALRGQQPARIVVLPPPPQGPDIYTAIEVASKVGKKAEEFSDESVAVVCAALGVVVLAASSVIVATTPAGNPAGNARAIDAVNRFNDDLDGQRARCATGFAA